MSDFKAEQRRFTAHLRDPKLPPPSGIEDRRMKVYRDLIYNNVEQFLRKGFPVLHSLMAVPEWHAMVRDFLRLHRCKSPFFHDISLAFVEWMQQQAEIDQPRPFAAELAHYEWVELALAISDQNVEQEQVDANGDLAESPPAVSPLAWCLHYRFPVHRIGPDFQPQAAEDGPWHFVVFRDRSDQVRFLQSNPLTHALLETLRQTRLPGRAVLAELAEALGQGEVEAWQASGLAILQRLRAQGVILGTWLADTVEAAAESRS